MSSRATRSWKALRSLFSRASSNASPEASSAQRRVEVVTGRRSPVKGSWRAGTGSIQFRQASSVISTATQLSLAKSKNSTSRKRAVGTGVGVNRHVSGSLPSSRPATRSPIQTLGFVPAIRGSCWKTYGAQVPGTVILTRPPWALAVSIWPCMPGIGTLVAVGSHCSCVLNHATGFSWGSILAVVGLMLPELMICLSFWPVV